MADSIFFVGRNVFIRTITTYFAGRIESVGEGFVTLADAAWVADTGRFGEAMKTGVFDSVEPYAALVSVSLAAIIEVTDFKGTLPLEVK